MNRHQQDCRNASTDGYQVAACLYFEERIDAQVSDTARFFSGRAIPDTRA
jgi:hypothetical protein